MDWVEIHCSEVRDVCPVFGSFVWKYSNWEWFKNTRKNVKYIIYRTNCGKIGNYVISGSNIKLKVRENKFSVKTTYSCYGYSDPVHKRIVDESYFERKRLKIKFSDMFRKMDEKIQNIENRISELEENFSSHLNEVGADYDSPRE